MKFSQIYRISLYVMLVLATLVVSIDATSDNALAMLYPPAVAIAGVLSFLTVDRLPNRGISRGFANLLAVGSIALSYFEYTITEHLLLALAHWLVYLQLIEMFLPKTVETDWFLIVLGLMEVLVGTVMSQSDVVGSALFAWTLSALWVLSLFYLHREAQKQHVRAGETVEPASPKGTPYPGLFDTPFYFASLRVAAVTLGLGGVIFLAMPRRTPSGWGPRTLPVARHLTGFGEEIQLGQLGEILENDSIVMSVELFDGLGNRIKPPDEPLWRGVSMVSYDNGKWSRGQNRVRGLNSDRRGMVPAEQQIVQRIKLEPTDTPVLFALRPILDVRTPGRMPPSLNPSDGTLRRPDVRSGSYDYDVYSSSDTTIPQPHEQYPEEDQHKLMLDLPSPLDEHLRKIAEPLVAGIPPGDLAGRARALEAYLRDKGGFGYTLEMGVTDPSMDPVEDFLVNRKQGHCAYFASALALLLRSIDIPARMINGFKGGDWNDLTSAVTVRQKHAHSWVEALVGREQFGRRSVPVWLTLDPTPAEAQADTIARVGGVPRDLRMFSDFVRYVWIFYVVGFDSERQERLVYHPIQLVIAQSKRGYEMIAHWLGGLLSALFHFPDVASFFSVRGFVVTFSILVLVVFLYRAARWASLRLLRMLRGADEEAAALAASVAFYRRLVQLLARLGLERPQAETPQEFARRASGFLSGRGGEASPLAEVPPRVVEAFYRIRFGQRTLDPAFVRGVEADLDALEATLPRGRKEGR